jgi:hypothetical protein
MAKTWSKKPRFAQNVQGLMNHWAMPNYSVYHWDTFDWNETILVTLGREDLTPKLQTRVSTKARDFVKEHIRQLGRIRPTGRDLDKVDIAWTNNTRNIVEQYSVG